MYLGVAEKAKDNPAWWRGAARVNSTVERSIVIFKHLQMAFQ